LPGVEALDGSLRDIVGGHHEITNIEKESEKKCWDETGKDNGHGKLLIGWLEI
jgi:hypothetical protein